MSDSHQAEITAAQALLPAWFVARMMADTWQFGLLMVNGDVLAVSRIESVRQAEGGLWLEVELLEESDRQSMPEHFKSRLIFSPTARTGASVQVCHVMAAFELADT